MDLSKIQPVCGKHFSRLVVAFRSNLSPQEVDSEIDSILDDSSSCSDCQYRRRLGEKPVFLNSRPAPFWLPLQRVKAVDPRDPPIDPVDWFNKRKRRAEMLQKAGLFPMKELTAPLQRKLDKIEATIEGVTPGSARLVDGAELPRVVFVSDEAVLRSGLSFWYHFVAAADIEDISPSDYTLPAKYRRELHSVGETSMSSLEFIVHLKGDISFPCWYSGANDFIELPEPHRPDDIIGVNIRGGLARTKEYALQEPDFVWCIVGGHP